MSYSGIIRFIGVLALVLNFCTVAGYADDGHGGKLRYRYVDLDQITLPSGFTSFFPTAIRDNGWVYGTICDSTCSITQLAYVKDGGLIALGAIPPGSFTGPVNKNGVVGGAVAVDPVNFIYRAALFRGAKVELVPPQPGELFASVDALNDHDTAIVSSFDASFNGTFLLYSKGQASPIDFGPNLTNPGPCFTFNGISRCINNRETIEGTRRPGPLQRSPRLPPRHPSGRSDDPQSLSWGSNRNARLGPGYKPAGRCSRLFIHPRSDALSRAHWGVGKERRFRHLLCRERCE